MSRHPIRDRLSSWRRAGAKWRRQVIETLLAHPRRTVRIGAILVVLLALVATTTLPMALAPTAPGLARALNGHDPQARLAEAEAARADFFKLNRASQPAAPQPATEPEKVDTIAELPEAQPAAAGSSGDVTPAENEDKATHIRKLAAAVTAVDPLNPVPFRMEAEVTSDGDEKRRLMDESAKRSRRDLPTIIWLFQDDLKNKRYESALSYADMLLRTTPGLQGQVLAILGHLAEDPEGRPALLHWLAKSASWRLSFFRALNRGITQADTPFKLMQDLEKMGEPPTPEELNQYLTFLLEKKFPDYAYNVWLQTQPVEVLRHMGFLNNPSFEQDPAGDPYDWSMTRSRNAVGEFIPLPDLGGQRAFHVVLGPGRVQFPQLRQTINLTPGRYRLDGKIRGTVVGKRGLVWQVQCYYKANPPLGRTEQLLGQSGSWRLFSLEFQVPDTPECKAQILSLIHDARSASEELVTGEAWFDDLNLTRVEEPKN